MVVSNFDAMIPYVFFLQFIKVKVGLEESCIAFLQVEEKKNTMRHHSSCQTRGNDVDCIPCL